MQYTNRELHALYDRLLLTMLRGFHSAKRAGVPSVDRQIKELSLDLSVSRGQNWDRKRQAGNA